MAPVRQSASKEEFLKALNLDSAKQDDRTRFATMWEEVTRYWVNNFEVDDRSILKAEYSANSGVRRPYKWAHLSGDRIDLAIKQIWENGKPIPRHYYDQGRSEDDRVYNWVLKWLLWHVCRYRDWRNRKSRPSNQNQPIQVPAQPEREYWTTVMDGRP